jgi:hypothetical protein
LLRLGAREKAQSDQFSDLVLAAAAGYMFRNESEGEFITQQSAAGTHGYANTDIQMQAILIAAGADIPKGIQLRNISNLDVAPTIAALLGIDMKRGRVTQLSRPSKPTPPTDSLLVERRSCRKFACVDNSGRTQVWWRNPFSSTATRYQTQFLVKCNGARTRDVA